jgi:hypothetical protein
VSDVSKPLLGGAFGIILGGNEKVTSHTGNHDEENSDDKSWQKRRVEWQTPNDMHLGDIISGEGPVVLQAVWIFVSSANVSQTVILYDQEKYNIC